jgi:hypothetical protein
MNLLKKKDKRLTNYEGAKWIDVFLRQIWPDGEIIEGVESKDEVSAEDNDSSATHNYH